jgi:hypothetical protein
MASRIQHHVAQVERRLLAARAFSVWPWCACAMFVAAAAAIAVDKYAPFLHRAQLVWSTVLGMATGLSVVAALVWAWLQRDDTVTAAIELDRRCRLQERVSTALAMRDAPEDDRAAAAVRADAERALQRVDVAASFPLAASRRWAWPLVPLAAALAATQLVSPVAPPPAEATPTVTAQVRESAADLERKLNEQRREAERLQLAEAQKLLEQLQEEARQLRDADKTATREALMKLNDLGQKLADRREQVSGAKELQKQLSRLRSKEKGPAEKFTESLAKGDYRQAASELEKLRRQLDTGKMSGEQQQKLQKQLDSLQKQVEDLAKAQEQRNEDLKQQLAQQEAKSSKPGGESGEAAQDDQGPKGMSPAELSQKMAEASDQQQQLDNLQQSINDAARNLEQGDAKGAKEALGQLQDQLDELGDKLSEMKLLDEGLLNVEETKSDLAQGEGDEQQPGQSGKGKPGQPGDQQNQQAQTGQGATQGGPGNGIGDQPGNRPENPTAANDKDAFDSRVRAEARPGEMRVIGPTDGPNAKGQALEMIRAQTDAAVEQGPAPALDRRPLDRSRREQKKQYFDALRKE